MKHWLDEANDICPKKIAIIYNDNILNYDSLYSKSIEMARKLANIGVKKGSHVGIYMENSLEFIYLIHALNKLEAVMIPFNTRLKANEIANQINHVNPDIIITDKKLGGVKTICLRNLSEMDPIQVDFKNSVDLSLIQGIVFTSGTTGKPKGVILSNDNHFTSAQSSAQVLGVEDGDVWLNCISLFHVGGLEIIFRACIYKIAIVLHQEFDEKKIIHSIYKRNVSLISLVPIMLKRLIDKSSLINTKLRCVLIGGANCPQNLVERALILKLPLALTYGMTEATSQVATSFNLVHLKPQSVGPPLPGTEVRIVNKDGEIGEIEVKGTNISQGYYNQPELNKKIFVDGYFKTGDIGYMDTDGYLYVLQRRVDLIVTGGENVIPSEVEDLVKSHQLVFDCIVFGIDDKLWGQMVSVVVVADKSLKKSELREYCKARIANYMIPKKYFRVEALPVSSSGKIDRKEIKEGYHQFLELV
ncbi:MAG: o-succinylbenzoate--CoA ligase [Candidatus Heimdallarchaeota archaeon]|nr:o-succinylbenzoate--CoA ligase [Candidatus Heimdallarchaeota archaeon]